MRVDNDSNLDEVTGLSAFDDLDPISAVSELAPLPGEQAFAGGTSDSGVPPATTAQQPSSAPPPMSSTHGHPTLPPPVPTTVAGESHRSFPPPMPEPQAESLATKHFDLDGPDESADADVTMQLDASELMSAGLLSPLSPKPTVRGGRADDTEVNDLPPSAAANLDMEWDEEEMETRIRDDLPSLEDVAYGMHGSEGPGATPSIVPGGNPSPFPSAPATSFPPPAQRESAITGAAVDRGHRATVEVAAPSAGGFLGSRAGLLAAVAVLCVVAVWAASSLLSPSEATITLATTPADAEVTLDGERLVEQTSPYVLTVRANEPHQLVVSKDGFESYTMTLDISGGDNKALPQIELRPIVKDTGFTIDSAPSGLAVLVDGRPTGQVTPARVKDVPKGAHLVSLGVPAGYEPFEIRVFVPDNEVIELPKAELIRSDGAVAAAAAAAPAPVEGAAVERSRRADRPMRAAQPTTRKRAPARAGSRFARAPSRAAAPQGASGTGILRLNSRPWSQIAVDGRPMGNTPQLNLQVPAGNHTVKFSNPQMGLAKTVQVKVRKGQTVTKVINLID